MCVCVCVCVNMYMYTERKRHLYSEIMSLIVFNEVHLLGLEVNKKFLLSACVKIWYSTNLEKTKSHKFWLFT